jgi:hypothetical protein
MAEGADIFSSAVQVVQQVGFPIAVSFYLLFRLEKKVDKQTEVMQSAVVALTALKDSVDHHDDFERRG